MRRSIGGRFLRSTLQLTMLGLCAAGLIPVARAAPVYRCLDTQGQVAYQDRACAPTQQETQLALAALPPPQSSPDYGHGARQRASDTGERKRAAGRPAPRKAPVHEPVSYECRAADGEVFYKHTACPKSIRTHAATRSGRRGRATSESIAVSGSAVSRAEACRRLAASPARAGHERDDQVSTYERNLGRDPCRRL